ncbi:hypothetical protein [Fodinibius sediminis]|uniref:Uncharacterized protein n=1 Tax=Fodinibius sediminis TaxID=1214077 RepID=A0A521BY68_9BACT|nr:hypothetical protein [Fodinibius sediminis]SMO51531.1 hypothetical protein SAMN06265218_104115 [Fodinibius sediminis]
MSNKLKTLSSLQLETLISDAVSDYIGEDCSCQISNLDTPNIDSEADIAIEDKRTLHFEIELSYEDS